MFRHLMGSYVSRHASVSYEAAATLPSRMLIYCHVFNSLGLDIVIFGLVSQQTMVTIGRMLFECEMWTIWMCRRHDMAYIPAFASLNYMKFGIFSRVPN